MNHFPIIRSSISRVEYRFVRTYNARHSRNRRLRESMTGHEVSTQIHIRSHSSRNTPTTKNTNNMPSVVPLVPEQRERHDCNSYIHKRPLSTNGHGRWRKAYIALGSNVGDRLEMIEKACQMLSANSNIRILRTSSLYETAPMYVAEQGRFLNGACEVRERG